VDVPPAAAKKSMLENGMPETIVDALLELSAVSNFRFKIEIQR
jgi:hypothetical protein